MLMRTQKFETCVRFFKEKYLMKEIGEGIAHFCFSHSTEKDLCVYASAIFIIRL